MWQGIRFLLPEVSLGAQVRRWRELVVSSTSPATLQPTNGPL
jgi:hypothetical protein